MKIYISTSPIGQCALHQVLAAVGAAFFCVLEVLLLFIVDIPTHLKVDKTV